MPVYSYYYSLPYLILLLFYMFLFKIELRFKNMNRSIIDLRWITVFAFLIFFGLRGHLYTDWIVYKPIFDGIPTLWDNSFKNFNSIYNSDIGYKLITDSASGTGGIEKGFILYILIFKSIIPNYFIWVFFNTILHVLILDRFFSQYSKYYILSFILYLVFGGLTIEINLMRNIFVILLFLISIKYIIQRNFFKFFLINLIGFTFHSSAILFLPLYFVVHKEWPNWFMWSVFIVGNIVFIVHVEYLKPILLYLGSLIGGRIEIQINAFYISDLYSRSFNFGLGFIERTFTFLIIMSYKKLLIHRNHSYNVFVNSFFIYMIIYLFFYELQVFIERLTLLFAFSYWIIYPNVIPFLKRKNIFIMVIFVYSCLKIIKMNSNVLTKYDNLIFGIESFEVRKHIMDMNIEKILYN